MLMSGVATALHRRKAGMRGVCVCVHVPMQPNRISEDLGVIEPKSILWSLRTEQYRVLLS